MVEKVSELEVDGSLSWLVVEGDLLYAIHEDSDLVSRWRLASDLRSLERLERVRIPSSGPAHLAVVKHMVRITLVRPGPMWMNVPRSCYASNLMPYETQNTSVCTSLVLYHLWHKKAIIGPFHAWKPTILMP